MQYSVESERLMHKMLEKNPASGTKEAMRTLVIAEKPSVAKDIAQVLGAKNRVNDNYENDKYIVTYALGHLVELAMPEDFDGHLKRWDFNTLPILPSPFPIKENSQTKDRLHQVVKLLNRKDIDHVINACDSGREGELIFTYIYDFAKCQKPFSRLWMVSMTEEGIRSAFSNLRTAQEMENLQQAARCRSEADWLIGINGTRAVTLRLRVATGGHVSSVGRVQTPTLAMIVNRDREIRNFQPIPFWRIEGEFLITNGEYKGMLAEKTSSRGGKFSTKTFLDKVEADQTLENLQQAVGALVKDSKKRTKQAPPRLYDLTSLQKEANVRFHLPAARTLQIAQALYEKYKLITYPRTDAKALPEDYKPVCEKTLAALAEPYSQLAKRVLSDFPIRATDRKIFNNKEVSDHFAIIPTPTAAKKLGEMEQKIYDLITRRFIAVFYPPAEFDVTTRQTTVGDYCFISEGKVLAIAGYLEVFGKEVQDQRGLLPGLSDEDGQPAEAKIQKIEEIEDKTRPPAHYTEATLLTAMETAGRLVEESELAEAMKEKGLGTPATRAQIIDNLIQSSYLTRDNRNLLATAKSERLLDFLQATRLQTLNDPTMTGEWEFKLKEIEKGQFHRQQFMKEIEELTSSMVEKIRTFEEEGDESLQPSEMISPIDGKPLLENYRSFFTPDKKYSINKIIGGHVVTQDEIILLLKEGKTGPIEDFKSRAGKPFKGCIAMMNGRARIEFAQEQGESAGKPVEELLADSEHSSPIAICPLCGGTIFVTDGGYICENLPTKKCKLRVSRRILSRDLDIETFQEMVKNGTTQLLEGFISNRTHKPFSAHLLLDKSGSIRFQFPPREKKPAADKKTAEKAKTSKKETAPKKQTRQKKQTTSKKQTK